MNLALDTHEAASRTGLSSSTLRKLRLTGCGPKFLKLGRAVRYREIDLNAWLDEREVRSTSETSPRRVGLTRDRLPARLADGEVETA